MPYSAIFVNHYLRASPFVAISLRQPKLTLTATTPSLQFSRRLHSYPRNPRLLRPPRPPLFVASNRPQTVAYSSVTHVSRHRRLRSAFGFTCSAASSSGVCSAVVLKRGNASSSYFYQQNSQYGRYAYDDYVSEEESDREVGSGGSGRQACASTLENIEEWKWKLTMLMRNKDEQEVVSRGKKDRRDFEQISMLATRMGLYSRQYAKVVVFSKVPLPNYRSDLDDKRPQREVVLPFELQRQVDAHLKGYISRKPVNKERISDDAFLRSSSGGSHSTGGLYEQEESLTQGTSVAAEKILLRRSLQLCNKQQDWQESSDGQKMQEFRRSLPAYKERDALLNAIAKNQVLVVSGETGCGKTTQLPQYILESETEAARGALCNIICTQPRRISAMAVAERVAAERGEKLGESVGFKVRLEGMKGRETRLLFCTTGILLRRLLVDRKLKGVTHVIVDEIHERGMNEDFLLIVLKDLLPRRPELRLILMSATLNAELFSSYFGGAPMIHIPGFTYPVRSYFLENILEMTGHRLTTYNQIDNYGQEKMWKMQKQAVRKRKSQIASAVEDALETADFRQYGPRTQESLSCWNPDSIGFNLIEHVLCHICKKERPGAVLVFMTGWDDINSLKEQLQAHPLLGDPSRVLLLACHGSMASSEQRLIFNKPEEGVRKIVLATNMAETSITINDVVFVVDGGKAKETSYDALNNTPCLLPSWISKASARQRRGRAGRVQPGECFHLYPRCVYDAFADYQLPELLRTPLQSLCLQIKSLQLGSISEFLSRALQPPEPLSVQNAIEYLEIIGALDENENLTVLGHHLSMLPVEPKLGKMLILGAIFNCLDPIMTVVSGLSVRDPFLMPFDKKDLAESAKAQFSARDYSDHLALVRAYEGWRDAERQQSGYEFCWRNFLSAQTLKAIDSLRKQFLFLLKDAGLVDNNIETCNTWSHDDHLIRAIICAGLFPGICSVVKKDKSIALKTMEDGPVLLYSNSVNAQELKIPYPWLVFNEKVKVNSVFLRDSTAVSDSVVLLFGGKISKGGLDGHLKMLGGYLEFFMNPALAGTYISLKRELEELIQKKLLNSKFEIHNHNELLSAVRLLVSEDQCEGRFVFGRNQVLAPPEKAPKDSKSGRGGGGGGGGDNSKSQLQTLLARAGHGAPTYKTKELKKNKFRTTVIFNGLNFVGQPCSSKKVAEKMGTQKIQLALVFLIWASLSCLSSSLPSEFSIVDQSKELVSEERIAELFEQWKQKHGKVYKHVQEAEKRFHNFKNNLKYILEKNSKKMSSSGHTVGLNKFADLSNEEFKAVYTSKIKKPLNNTSFDGQSRRNVQGKARTASCDAPSSLDWRKYGIVTGVKDQGSCGSCWAFSTTGAIEGINALVTGELISLSEQELVDCDSTDEGCDGGYMDYAFEWVVSNGGIDTEADYPYTGVDGTCSISKEETKVVSIDGYTDIAEEESALLCAVINQPISVGMDGSAIDFQLYTSGIYDGSCSDNPNDIDHAVLIVGYGSEGDEDYWIIKNSWGTYWGMEGYGYIRRNTDATYGVCAINAMASYPTKESSSPSPYPSPTPPPPPSPPPPPPSPPSPSPSECGDFSYCPADETCCCIFEFFDFCLIYGCCEYENAVCCTGTEYCCPSDYPICDTEEGLCLKNAGDYLGINAKKRKIAKHKLPWTKYEEQTERQYEPLQWKRNQFAAMR